MHKIREKLGYV